MTPAGINTKEHKSTQWNPTLLNPGLDFYWEQLSNL